MIYLDISSASRASITIYTPNNGIYIKKVIPECIIRSAMELSFKSQGVLPLNTTKIYIPYDESYVDERFFNKVGWTIKTGSNKNTSYIVEGECDYNFPVDNDDISKSIRYFESNYVYMKPKFIKVNYMVNGNLNHIGVIC